MGIIFNVVSSSKSDVIKVLTEILKEAENKGVVIYAEDECMSYESKYGQPRGESTRTSNK